jgi:hypothetical protein
MKHTPGPWVFNETVPRMVSSKQGYITRDICRLDGSTMQAFEQDANARLIAAAPKMAKALEYISRRLQADIDDGSRPDQWSMEDMERMALEALPEGYEEQ